LKPCVRHRIGEDLKCVGLIDIVCSVALRSRGAFSHTLSHLALTCSLALHADALSHCLALSSCSLVSPSDTILLQMPSDTLLRYSFRYHTPILRSHSNAPLHSIQMLCRIALSRMSLAHVSRSLSHVSSSRAATDGQHTLQANCK